MGGREEVTPFRILEALPTKWRTGGPEATEVSYYRTKER